MYAFHYTNLFLQVYIRGLSYWIYEVQENYFLPASSSIQNPNRKNSEFIALEFGGRGHGAVAM